MATIDVRPSLPSKILRTFVRASRIAAARLRFLAVFGVVFLVVGGWEPIRTYWTRWTAGAPSEQAVSSDTQYFCPMDPGILSDWPSKCPVCNMSLVRRKKGESAPLPDGVVARMQFTPYRLWLGGIRTATIEYAALARILEAPGTVTANGPGPILIEAEFFTHELAWLAAGQDAEVTRFGDPVATPIKAKVRETPRNQVAPDAGTRVVVELDGGSKNLPIGAQVRVKVHCPVEKIEPFRDLPSRPPALLAGEPRQLYTCMDHVDVGRDSPGLCPRDQSELMARPLRSNQRVRWWCPMHPSVTADRTGERCDVCGGMPLVPRIVSYRLPGTVLSVPAAAVIVDGARAIVYVERGAGMFDGVVVMLGPRCDTSFPVVSGLEPGDRVAAQGAFLIDAETRLNPSLATGYFGAGERAGVATKTTSEEKWLQGLAADDRPAAFLQKVCPVTGKALGSMGVPTKVDVRGRSVFLCCDGCSGAIQANPERYLAKLPREKSDGQP